MSNIYCGIDKVPKGKVRGTAEQCLKCGQVRYWGRKKIDKELLKGNTKEAKALTAKQNKKDEIEAIRKFGTTQGKIRKLEFDIQKWNKRPDKVEEFQKKTAESRKEARIHYDRSQEVRNRKNAPKETKTKIETKQNIDTKKLSDRVTKLKEDINKLMKDYPETTGRKLYNLDSKLNSIKDSINKQIEEMKQYSSTGKKLNSIKEMDKLAKLFEKGKISPSNFKTEFFKFKNHDAIKEITHTRDYGIEDILVDSNGDFYKVMEVELGKKEDSVGFQSLTSKKFYTIEHDDFDVVKYEIDINEPLDDDLYLIKEKDVPKRLKLLREDIYSKGHFICYKIIGDRSYNIVIPK